MTSRLHHFSTAGWYCSSLPLWPTHIIDVCSTSPEVPYHYEQSEGSRVDFSSHIFKTFCRLCGLSPIRHQAVAMDTVLDGWFSCIQQCVVVDTVFYNRLFSVKWSEVKCTEVNCGWMKGRPHDTTYIIAVTLKRVTCLFLLILIHIIPVVIVCIHSVCVQFCVLCFVWSWCYFVWCVLYVYCILPLPSGKTPFTVNNNNNNNNQQRAVACDVVICKLTYTFWNSPYLNCNFPPVCIPPPCKNDRLSK
jgi:hypothetical protein